IGGNVAENAGGPHCLKYGVTATHILALEVVLADGRVLELGSPGGEPWGPDLVGLFVGSEGNFGVATRITVSNVFHAGDGNLHPNISFDGRVPGLKARV